MIIQHVEKIVKEGTFRVFTEEKIVLIYIEY